MKTTEEWGFFFLGVGSTLAILGLIGVLLSFNAIG
jgi:hypothetical protein